MLQKVMVTTYARTKVNEEVIFFSPSWNVEPALRLISEAQRS